MDADGDADWIGRQGPPVAAAILVERGRVLLVRRRSPEGGLLWQFPAGAIELEESPEAAAVRESAEEAGIRVRSERVLGKRVHPITGRTVVYVACEPLGGHAYVASAREIAEVAWVGTIELRTKVPAGVYRPVQEYLNKVLDDE